MTDYVKDLCTWLDGGLSPWHTVQAAADFLAAQGFAALAPDAPFAVERGGKYYVSSDTLLIALSVGQAAKRFRVAAAHTDWPCMRLPPQKSARRSAFSNEFRPLRAGDIPPRGVRYACGV